MRPIARPDGSALLAIAALLVAASCGAGDAGEGTISADTLLSRLDGGEAPLVLDVRTPREYAAGHVPGAVNVPHDEVEAALARLDAHRERPVVVYCERGGRASRAGATLREAGFREVLHLEGDMRAWRERDLPCTGC